MLCLGNTLLWTWWQAKRIIIPKPSLCLFLKINYNLSLSQSHLFRLSNSDLLKLSLKPMNQSFSLLSPYVCIKIFSILNQKNKNKKSIHDKGSPINTCSQQFLSSSINRIHQDNYLPAQMIYTRNKCMYIWCNIFLPLLKSF